jgi:hypothetical protein
LALARHRERTSVSAKKSDHLDAMELANILRTDRLLHRFVARRQCGGPGDRRISPYQDAVWRRPPGQKAVTAAGAGMAVILCSARDVTQPDAEPPTGAFLARWRKTTPLPRAICSSPGGAKRPRTRPRTHLFLARWRRTT